MSDLLSVSVRTERSIFCFSRRWSMSKIFSLRPSPGSAACSLRRSSFNWRTVLIEDIADGWLLILLHVASTLSSVLALIFFRSADDLRMCWICPFLSLLPASPHPPMIRSQQDSPMTRLSRPADYDFVKHRKQVKY